MRDSGAGNEKGSVPDGAGPLFFTTAFSVAYLGVILCKIPEEIFWKE
jgi:hypothetical protein